MTALAEPGADALPAADAGDQQDELLVLLGHELRGRVHALCGALEVLEASAPGSATDAEARQVAMRQARQIAGVVDELLASGRVLSGRVAMASHRVELSALVQRLLRTHGIAAHCESVEPVWIRGDLLHLEQGLGRLLCAARARASTFGVTVRCERARGVVAITASAVPLGNAADELGLALATRLLRAQGAEVATGAACWRVAWPLDAGC